MKPIRFEEKISENIESLSHISLFNYILIFMTSFLVFVLIFVLLSIDFYLATIPALIIVALSHRKKEENPIDTMEDANPALKDRLQTAYDNRGHDNFIVRELIREVGYDLNNVETEKFIDLKKTYTYITISIIVVFILLFLMLTGFEGYNLPALFGGGVGGDGGSGGQEAGSGGGGGGADDASGESPADQEVSMGMGAPQDIYGDSSIAHIQGEELDLEVHPDYGEEGDFNNEDQEAEAQIDEIKGGFAKATAAEAYIEDIPVELENVVREYFERLSED